MTSSAVVIPDTVRGLPIATAAAAVCALVRQRPNRPDAVEHAAEDSTWSLQTLDRLRASRRVLRCR